MDMKEFTSLELVSLVPELSNIVEPCTDAQTHCNSRNADRDIYYSLAQWYRNQPCFCDANCRFYGDCCNNSLNTGMFEHDTLSCERRSYSSEKVYSVYKCPTTWENDDIRKECEDCKFDLINNVPVIDSNDIIYKNVYCTTCHAVSTYKFFLIDLKCLENNITVQNIQDHLDSNKCKRNFFPPVGNRTLHYCKNFISHCSMEWDNDTESTIVRDKCFHSSVRFVYTQYSVYKNEYCARCNFELFATCEKGRSSDFSTFALSHLENHEFYPLSIMFDLNVMSGVSSNVGYDLVKTNMTVDNTEVCRYKEVYDPFIGKCRSISCIEKAEYINGSCVNI